jgi:cytoskeletal protein CcmA (bactofilin family)
MAVLAFFMLLLLTGAVCLAPLLPAWQEWRLRRDALPLGIEQSEYTSVRVFAERFRNHLQRELVALDTNGNGDQDYLLINDNNGFAPARLEQSGQRLQRRVISDASLKLPDGYSFEREVYSRGDLHSGRRSRLRAALADARLDLGEGSVVLRWADATEIHVAPQARLLGRAAATQSITLAAGSEFRRLHAPSIVFGAAAPANVSGAVPESGSGANAPESVSGASSPESVSGANAPESVSGAKAPQGGPDPLMKARAATYEHFGPPLMRPRWLVRDELSVPDNRQVNCALVVRGRLNIGAGAYLTKGIKSYKNIVIGDGAIIDGSIVSRRDVSIGARCIITGPVVAQGRVSIGAGSRFGSIEQPTTVTARTVSVASGAIIHGTVWGREQGSVS